ncbi:MAG TPA: hypothetical protein DCS82_08365 [Rhodospirillaceae bacterium]|nr:hypothetical protein [Rhodospirillaceae bacterium]HAT35715.1 hypothetical protein [Rhodospirillaceae bacterium]
MFMGTHSVFIAKQIWLPVATVLSAKNLQMHRCLLGIGTRLRQNPYPTREKISESQFPDGRWPTDRVMIA